MKKLIVCAIVGITMVITSNPVFAENLTTIKNLEPVNFEYTPNIFNSKNLNFDVLKSDSKLSDLGVVVNQESEKTFQQMIGSEADLRSSTNNTPNTAIAIGIGNVYDDIIVKEGEQKWYAFENKASGKLTVYMQTLQDQNINYNLHLFKYNETTNGLDPVVSSIYPATINQQLSTVANNGIYFIAINSVKGFDDKNSFKFIVNYSAKYGNNEPDDNLFQGKSYQNTLSMIDSIDNVFDEDWCNFDVATDTNYSLSLQNTSTKGKYIVDIISENLTILATIEQNKVSQIQFPKGKYYIRISPLSGFDADVSYKFNIDNLDTIVTNTTISKISSDGGVEGFIDYGLGKKWRIKSNIVVEGIAYNKFGKIVPNQQVSARIIVKLNNKSFVATGVTDANGNFKIPISGISPAIGAYTFSAPTSTHYYDVIPFDMIYNNKIIPSGVNSLYHFAYSIYRP